jgi:RND family efflux transporter MFP subunit
MKTVIAVLMLAAANFVSAESTDLVKLDDKQITAFGIETAQIQKVDQSVSKPYPAKVVVPNTQLRVVGSPLDGVIESLLVAEGEAVTQDQPLAQIRSTKLLELQAAYLETRTRRLLSSETLARERKLHAEGITAERRLIETESANRELLNAEARDRQALGLGGMPEAAITELERKQRLNSVLTVKSPLAGVVLEQLATAGQRLAAADPLYRIGDLSSLWIEVHVPLESLGEAAPGSVVDLPELGIRGQVITVGRMVHKTDQGVLVRASVSEGADYLRPGQFVKAQLHQGISGSSLRVPLSAVVRSGDQDYVFVRRAEGFAPLPVQLYSSEGDGAVIQADLAADGFVAVRGTAALKAAWIGGTE